MSHTGSLDPFCRWEDWGVVTGLPPARLSRPSLRGHHLAQIQRSELESTIRFCGRPFCGISEQKCTLLPFINQSDSFKHSFPQKVWACSHTNSCFIKCFLKESVSSSEARAEGAPWSLSCFLRKLSWFRGQVGGGRKDLPHSQILKPFLLGWSELAKFPTCCSLQEPFKLVRWVFVSVLRTTDLPFDPSALVISLAFWTDEIETFFLILFSLSVSLSNFPTYISAARLYKTNRGCRYRRGLDADRVRYSKTAAGRTERTPWESRPSSCFWADSPGWAAEAHGKPAPKRPNPRRGVGLLSLSLPGLCWMAGGLLRKRLGRLLEGLLLLHLVEFLSFFSKSSPY